LARGQGRKGARIVTSGGQNAEAIASGKNERLRKESRKGA